MKKRVCNIAGIVLAENNKIFQRKPVQMQLSPSKNHMESTAIETGSPRREFRLG